MAIRHTKTNTIPDPTQAELDAQIAAGNYPPGTLLANITLGSDWNAAHTNPDITDVTGLQAALDAKQDVLTGLTASVTELNYTDGVTSAIQTQLDGKQGDITLTTVGTSGVATLIGDTLNIPNYADTDTGITQLTGDVEAGPGSGSQVATLATVNANVGSFGSATQVMTQTVNAKGLTTSAANVAIAIPSTQVTDFTEAAQDAIGAMVNTSLTYTDGGPSLGLTSRTINGTAFDGTGNITVTAAAGTLTGATLAAGVTASSLTSVGTIGTGLWQGTAIADAYIASAATWNAKQSAITFGTGVQTALGVNIGSAGAPVLFNGAGGTPSSLVGTNITGTAAGLSIGGAAPAGSLSGATLAAGVTASSLTSVGTITTGTWDGTDIAVTAGGTGRSTSTTAYGLIAAGTTATGAHQTLAAGATTTILVGGGASALPVWTTASGTGAPLRQGTPTITTAVLNGTVTGTSVATVATANTLAKRDASGNLTANNWTGGYTTTATAAGTTTLTVASTFQQFFTGATTQTITLPVVTTLALGHQFQIVNNSAGALTVNSSGANLVVTIAPGTWANVNCILITGTTAASWSVTYNAATVASGKKLAVNNTLTLAGTDATTMTFPTTSATIARTDAAQTFTGVQTMTNPNIIGITSVAAAAAGSLGEIVTGSAGAVALVNNTAKTLSSITLSAGVWNIYGYVDFGNSATTTVTLLAVCVNTTTDTFTGGGTSVFCNGGLAFNTATTFCSAVLNPRQVNISGSTTYYMVGFATFGVSTCSGTPTFWAERVR